MFSGRPPPPPTLALELESPDPEDDPTAMMIIIPDIICNKKNSHTQRDQHYHIKKGNDPI